MPARESITQPGETWNISIVEVTQEKQAEKKVRGKDRFFDSSMKRDNKFLRWNSIQEQFLMCKDAPSLTRRISSSTCKRRSRRTPYQALVKIETVAARASHQETLIQTNKEVEELRKVRCCATDLREAAFLQERQSTVTQLTHQPQEVVNSLSESQDFKDLETASSSGSANAPDKPFVFFRVFQLCRSRQASKQALRKSKPSLNRDFVRSLPTVELPPLMEEVYPRKFMVKQPKYNVLELQFEKFSAPSTYIYWNTNFKTAVCSGSGHPSEAMPWINEVGMAESQDVAIDFWIYLRDA